MYHLIWLFAVCAFLMGFCSAGGASPALASGVDNPPVFSEPAPKPLVRHKKHSSVDHRTCLKLAEQLDALEKKKQERLAQGLEPGPELDMDYLRPAMELCVESEKE